MYISARRFGPLRLPMRVRAGEYGPTWLGASECVPPPARFAPFGTSSGGLKAPVAVPRVPGRFGGCKSTCQFFWTKASWVSLSLGTGDVLRPLGGVWGAICDLGCSSHPRPPCLSRQNFELIARPAISRPPPRCALEASAAARSARIRQDFFVNALGEENTALKCSSP